MWKSISLWTYTRHSLRKYIINSTQCLTSVRHCTKISEVDHTEDDVQESETLIGKNFLSLKYFTAHDIKTFLWTATDLKYRIKQGELMQPLAGKSLGMVFQRKSTGTRIATETGMSLLGGIPCYLSVEDLHMGGNESIRDTARVLSKMVDSVFVHVDNQSDLDVIAQEVSIPVISGITDMHNPLQTLADILTLQEHFGYVRGLKIAYVGDGAHIAHSLLMGCTKMGIDISIATPNGYECDAGVIQDAVKFSLKYGTELRFCTDPEEAVSKADVIVTDPWLSNVEGEERERRLLDFNKYQVTSKLCSNAKSNWVFLHSLPRQFEEVADSVFNDQKRSLVWNEAENRKWTVMSVLLNLLHGHKPEIPKPKFGKLN